MIVGLCRLDCFSSKNIFTQSVYNNCKLLLGNNCCNEQWIIENYHSGICFNQQIIRAVIILQKPVEATPMTRLLSVLANHQSDNPAILHVVNSQYFVLVWPYQLSIEWMLALYRTDNSIWSISRLKQEIINSLVWVVFDVKSNFVVIFQFLFFL